MELFLIGLESINGTIPSFVSNPSMELKLRSPNSFHNLENRKKDQNWKIFEVN